MQNKTFTHMHIYFHMYAHIDTVDELKEKRAQGSRLRGRKKFYDESSTSSTPADSQSLKQKDKEAKVSHQSNLIL